MGPETAEDAGQIEGWSQVEASSGDLAALASVVKSRRARQSWERSRDGGWGGVIHAWVL